MDFKLDHPIVTKNGAKIETIQTRDLLVLDVLNAKRRSKTEGEEMLDMYLLSAFTSLELEDVMKMHWHDFKKLQEVFSGFL